MSVHPSGSRVSLVSCWTQRHKWLDYAKIIVWCNWISGHKSHNNKTLLLPLLWVFLYDPDTDERSTMGHSWHSVHARLMWSPERGQVPKLCSNPMHSLDVSLWIVGKKRRMQAFTHDNRWKCCWMYTQEIKRDRGKRGLKVLCMCEYSLVCMCACWECPCLTSWVINRGRVGVCTNGRPARVRTPAGVWRMRNTPGQKNYHSNKTYWWRQKQKVLECFHLRQKNIVVSNVLFFLISWCFISTFFSVSSSSSPPFSPPRLFPYQPCRWCRVPVGWACWLPAVTFPLQFLLFSCTIQLCLYCSLKG